MYKFHEYANLDYCEVIEIVNDVNNYPEHVKPASLPRKFNRSTLPAIIELDETPILEKLFSTKETQTDFSGAKHDVHYRLNKNASPSNIQIIDLVLICYTALLVTLLAVCEIIL